MGLKGVTYGVGKLVLRGECVHPGTGRELTDNVSSSSDDSSICVLGSKGAWLSRLFAAA